MNTNLFSVWRTELLALPLRLGTSASLLILAALLVLIGFVPKLIGADFFHPPLLRAYAALSFVFASPAVCESVADDAGRRLPSTVLWGKVLTGATFGTLCFAFLLFGRHIAILLEFGRWVTPGALQLLQLALSAIAMALAGAATAALLTLHTPSPRMAAQIMRTAFLMVFLAAVLTTSQMPWLWRFFFGYPGIAFLLIAGVLIARIAAANQRYSGSMAR